MAEVNEHTHDGEKHSHKSGGPHIHNGVQDSEYLKRVADKEKKAKK